MIRYLEFASLSASLGFIAPTLPRGCQGIPPAGSGGHAGTTQVAGQSSTLAGGAGGTCASSGGTPATGTTQQTTSAAGGTTADAGQAGASALGGQTVDAGTGGTGAADAGAGDASFVGCGNGTIDPGEICDDGPQNGIQGRCDSGCQFICTGSCPIRVSPRAATNGTGLTWDSPMNDLQAALDIQADRGGGDVWLLGDQVQYPTSSGKNLLTIRSHVSLLGGFDGWETSLDQRIPIVLTALQATGDGQAGTYITIDSASDVVVDLVAIITDVAALKVRSSRNVRLSDMLFSYVGTRLPESFIDVDDSDVRFESCTIYLPRFDPAGTDFVAERSNIAFASTDLYATTGPALPGSATPQFVARSSRVFFQSVYNTLLTDANEVTQFIIDESSEALFTDLQLDSPLIPDFDGPALQIDGQAAVIGGRLGARQNGPTMGVKNWAAVFNAGFLDNSQTAAVGHSESPWAIATGPSGMVEVSLSSFMGGHCPSSSDFACPAVERAAINNSLFAPLVPAAIDGGLDFPIANLVTSEGVLPASNCAAYQTTRFNYTSSAILTVPHPCPDSGDAARLETSLAQVLEFAAPFLVAPFNADLSRYRPGFWQLENTSYYGAPGRDGGALRPCQDGEIPDPGQHYHCSW